VSEANTIFLTWEWITCWAKSLVQKPEILVITIWSDNDELLGIAPFYKHKYKLLGVMPFSVLRIMGDYGTGSDYPNWIVHKKYEKQIIKLLVMELLSIKSRWDLIWMPNMMGWTKSITNIIEILRQTKSFNNIREMSFSFLDLPDAAESYEKKLSSNRRQQYKKQKQKIFNNGDIEIKKCKNKDELRQYLQTLFDLHYKRRSILGDEGTFRRIPQQTRFYEYFSNLALEKGWLWFYSLKENGIIRAIQYGYVYNGTFYQLQEGFDPDYIAGAGNVLRLHIIKDCIEHGLCGYDFLGEHTEHKRRWLSVERNGYDLLIGSNKLKNYLLFTKQVWPTGRFLKPVI
jgi:CelD/BcsL family acetyltransferase involved in cellulose biosynthesis